MKKLIRISLVLALVAGIATVGHAEEKNAAPTIKALLITGGCCHDYDNQKVIIPKGIEANTTARIEWTVVHEGGKTTNTEIPFYNKADWAKGYDVVVHNECFAAVGSEAFIDKILAPHRAGTPAVLVHCAMHCYRTGPSKEEWFKFCGVHSPRHGPHHPFEVQVVDQDHEVSRTLSNWTTPQGELYYIDKTYPGTRPLAESKSNKTGEMHINVWTHEYGENKARVFATTIGHHNITMEHPEYQRMMTRGFLWAAGQSVDDLIKD